MLNCILHSRKSHVFTNDKTNLGRSRHHILFLISVIATPTLPQLASDMNSPTLNSKVEFRHLDSDTSTPTPRLRHFDSDTETEINRPFFCKDSKNNFVKQLSYMQKLTRAFLLNNMSIVKQYVNITFA